jgi:mannose-6-phosphate isomerase-like protein (cupin superfamily)
VSAAHFAMAPAAALRLLDAKADGAPFTELFAHGSLSLEVYRPVGVDRQQVHARDELYVVIAGNGTFFHGGARTAFGPGDLLFVPAGVEHRFEDFSNDFSTWVAFYGPDGGENP